MNRKILSNIDKLEKEKEKKKAELDQIDSKLKKLYELKKEDEILSQKQQELDTKIEDYFKK